MTQVVERRYRISEVSVKTSVAIHLLRQWEAKVPQLKPKRDRTGLRYYTEADINIVRQLNYFIRVRKMTLKGASLELGKLLHGAGGIENREHVVYLIDKIEDEARSMLRLLETI